jgi:hypothetical protein
MKKPKSEVSISKLQVLQAISDSLSLELLEAVAKKAATSDDYMQMLDISRKQYYGRSSRLVNADLIKPIDGRYFLTSFGKLVYQAQLKISAAARCASELRMIDAIKWHSGLSDNEQKNLIDKIIVDSEIKKLIS